MYRKSLFDNLVVTDLEGALFQSKSTNPKGLYPMIETSNGRVEGWATEEQAQRWDTLRYEAFCVGYTSFSEPQVSRVTGWDPLHEHQLMLADHGMTLLYRDLSGKTDGKSLRIGLGLTSRRPAPTLKSSSTTGRDCTSRS